MAENVRSFRVEQAGCASCAERVRTALSPLGEVEQITIDEETDTADIVLRASSQLEQAQIDQALTEASSGSGHAYRVEEGSWQAA